MKAWLKPMRETQAMESDDWKPSQKMLDFMEKINNE